VNGFRSLKHCFACFKLICFAVFVLLLSACATDLSQRIDHNIVIKNSGKDSISDVYVDYGHPYRIEKKSIRSNAQTTDSGEYPIPAVMHASWTTSEGKRREAVVALKKNLEYATRLRAVELWINGESLEVYQATPRAAQEEFTDRKRIYPR
jgi:hypothetical protein